MKGCPEGKLLHQFVKASLSLSMVRADTLTYSRKLLKRIGLPLLSKGSLIVYENRGAVFNTFYGRYRDAVTAANGKCLKH